MNTTSYLLVTARWNWDATHKRAMDQNLVTKEMFAWGTKINVVPSGKDSSQAEEIDVQDLNKDTHDILLDKGNGSEIHKIVNVVNRSDGNTFAPKYKTITEDVVKDAAEKLMQGGSTSSLAVKEELRKDGYWAQQKDVSDHLQNIQRNNSSEWEVYFNGTFNEYSLSDDGGTATQAAATPGTSLVQQRIKTRVRRGPAKHIPILLHHNFSASADPADEAKKFIKDAIDNKKLNTQNFVDTEKLWVVYCPSTKDIGVYEEDNSSDDVRNAFRKVIGNLRIQMVRARRYKHIDYWKL